MRPVSAISFALTVGCNSPTYLAITAEQDALTDSNGPTGDSTEATTIDVTTTGTADEAGSGTVAASATSDVGETNDASTGSAGGGTDTDADSITTTSGAPGDSSTTGFGAFCGDGVINQEFEECDIPSPDPEGPCTAVCQRERIIFVLSISVNGKLSGLQGADAYCKSQATMAMKADPSSPIKDPNNFKALLSSSKETVFERHFRGEGPYRLVNGLTVSDSFSALFTAPLQNPINVDEFGHTRNIPVWTATTVDGLPYPGIDFCGDWESDEGSSSWGLSYATDTDWIDVGDQVIDNPTTDCYSDFALYCVEQQ